MNIKFKLDKDNLIDFYCRNILKTKVFKKVSLFFRIYTILLVIFVWLLDDEKGMRIFSIIVGTISIIFFKQFGKLVYKFIMPRNFKKIEYSYMINEIEIFLKEDNISIFNSLEKKIANYDSINSINITDENMFIIFSKKNYTLIPLSAFDDLKEKNKFIDLIEQKTNKQVKYSYPENLDYI